MVTPVRTLVDIPDDDLKALGRLGQRRRVSRANVIRQAVREYLARNSADPTDEAFGLWGGASGDGLKLQLRLRSEW